MYQIEPSTKWLSNRGVWLVAKQINEFLQLSWAKSCAFELDEFKFEEADKIEAAVNGFPIDAPKRFAGELPLLILLELALLLLLLLLLLDRPLLLLTLFEFKELFPFGLLPVEFAFEFSRSSLLTQFRSDNGDLFKRPRRTSCAAISLISLELKSL